MKSTSICVPCIVNKLPAKPISVTNANGFPKPNDRKKNVKPVKTKIRSNEVRSNISQISSYAYNKKEERNKRDRLQDSGAVNDAKKKIKYSPALNSNEGRNNGLTSHKFESHKNKKESETQNDQTNAVSEKAERSGGRSSEEMTVNSINNKQRKEGYNNWKQMLSKMPELSSKKKKEIVNTPKQEIGSNGVWFEGVDMNLLKQTKKRPREERQLVKDSTNNGVTKILAIDCEMVGIGYRGQESMLARVSIVNRYGHCIYDKYVKPVQEVTDYRTAVSGIRPGDLANGEEFAVVREEVLEILQGRIVVGHAIHHDFRALYIKHRRHLIRDTSKYKIFVDMNNGKTPSLRNLTDALLGIRIQEGEHSSVTDAQATMKLYTMHRSQWEKELKMASKGKNKVKENKLNLNGIE